MLVRCDSAGASHDFLNAVRAREKAKFWVGFELRDGGGARSHPQGSRGGLGSGHPSGRRGSRGRRGLRARPARPLWLADGHPRHLPPRASAPGSSALLHRSPGLAFPGLHHRPGGRGHRARARCEDQIRCAKETGLRAFPFQGFVQNPIWLELVLAAHDLLCHSRRVALTGEAQRWEPGALRTGCCTPPGAWSRGVAGLSSGSSATGPGPNFWPPPSLAFASSPRPDRGPTPNPHWS